MSMVTQLLQETQVQYTNSSTPYEKNKQTGPLMVLVGINDRWVEMEIDTGAAAFTNQPHCF